MLMSLRAKETTDTAQKFDFAHTLYIGRPKSHMYDNDVHLLKYSLV